MHTKRILYLGLDPVNLNRKGQITHIPLIQIVPYPLEQLENILINFPQFTHIIFTSKSAISIIIPYLEKLGFRNANWSNKIIAAVGQASAKQLQKYGLKVDIIAKEETAEGLITGMEALSFKHSHVFWPHSKLSRPLLKDYFLNQNIQLTECALYDTIPLRPCPLPELEDFDEIIFTSPSTIDAFLMFYNHLPKNKILTSIGPITERYLNSTC
jgi:uroporphyrinogen-III synthase